VTSGGINDIPIITPTNSVVTAKAPANPAARATTNLP